MSPRSLEGDVGRRLVRDDVLAEREEHELVALSTQIDAAETSPYSAGAMNRVRTSVPTSPTTRVPTPVAMFHATPRAALFSIDTLAATLRTRSRPRQADDDELTPWRGDPRLPGSASWPVAGVPSLRERVELRVGVPG